jgi:hypothetical protein
MGTPPSPVGLAKSLGHEGEGVRAVPVPGPPPRVSSAASAGLAGSLRDGVNRKPPFPARRIRIRTRGSNPKQPDAKSSVAR